MRARRRSLRHRRTIIMLSLAFLISMIWAANQPSTSPAVQSSSAFQAAGATNGKTISYPEPFVIVLDPGHGGHDPGAEGASGQYEKLYTQALTEKIFHLLRKETMFKPYMTRTSDTFIELEDRPAYANSLQADAFLSIHGNTFDDSTVSGTETYYWADDSVRLADILQRELVNATGFKDRGVKREEWVVLRDIQAPAVLLEVGFLTNPEEEKYLLGDQGQNQIAQAIVEGLKQYFEIFD